MLGPLTICRHGVAAGAAGVAQGARAARLSGACRRTPCRGASSASCCGTCPTIRAASCAGASARSGASSTSPAGAGSTPAATPSGSIWRTASSMRSRSPGRSEDIETLAPERLRALAALFAGDFLEGLEIDRSPAFNGWLTAQRRRFRGCHAALLEHLVKSASGRRGSCLSREVARAGAVRPACPRAAAERARPARPDPGGRGASGGDHPAVRGRGPRQRVRFAMHGGQRGRRRDSPPSVRSAVPDAAAATGSRRDEHRHRCIAPRLHRGDAVRRPVRRGGRPRRGCRRARPRRDHPARQAAQPVRHRAGDACSPCTSGASARKRPAGC